MKTFKEWIKIKEMAGGGIIVGNPSKNDCRNSNFQVWGAACQGKKKIKK